MVSTKSTLPNDEKEAQDSAYNPGEQRARELSGSHESIPGYDRSNDGLDDHPISHGDAPGIDPNDSTERIKRGEADGSVPPKGDWDTKVSPASNSNKDDRKTNFRAVIKKRGPLTLILTALVGGGFIGTALFSPGLLLVQMSESLTDRFNTQFASMDARTTRIMNSKINGTTSGICGSRITVQCKYSTISEKQAERFKNAGIEIEGETRFGKRIKPDAYIFNGERIAAKDFNNKLTSSVELRSTMKNIYNPKYAGFADATWSKVADRIGLSKQRNLVDGDKTKKDEGLDKTVREGKKFDLSDGFVCEEGKRCRNPTTGEELSESDSVARRAAIKAAEEAAEEVGENAAKALGENIGKQAGSVLNFVKVTGAVDDACQVYSSIRALGFAAKTIRAIQLARYAMVFVNTASQIKAGTATSEDVAYLGGILTSVAYDVGSGIKRKAAMDSAGMNFAMYGDTGGFKGQAGSYASQFMAGGGLTGDLIAVTDYINVMTANSPATACKLLGNGWVQLGSFVGGLALMFVPGANVALVSTKAVIKGVSQIAVQIGLAILPELLKDIVAGNITKGIVGEDAGNAIASGFGTISSQVAQAGGNAPMTVDQAVAYTNLNSEAVARYNADEAASLSPLDPTNKNTFVGSIVNKLLPYASEGSTFGSAVTSLGSLVSTSFANIVPKSSALSDEQLKSAYSTCTDPDLAAIKVAADPFCNPVYGIPQQYLSRDPIAVANALAGQYNASSGKPTSGTPYGNFVKACIERDPETPLGYEGDNFQGDSGEACKVNDSNANFYLFYMDQRIDLGMDGYESEFTAEAGDAASYAQEILDSGNVTHLASDGDDGSGPNEMEQIQAMADGSASVECVIDTGLLKMLAGLSKGHKFVISDLSRTCNKSNLSHSSGGHWLIPAVAVDFDSVDGDGNPETNINFINEALSYVDAGQNVSVGQVHERGGGRLSPPAGVTITEFDDYPGHLHMALK